jgi:DNA-binding NarL/FixJ family response regulator
MSKREIQVIQLIVEGKSNGEIAYILEIAEGTVITYIQRIFLKLNVTNRTQAAVAWVRKKEVTPKTPPKHPPKQCNCT